jgi:phosphoribosylglycinamide formyltransferase-1
MTTSKIVLLGSTGGGVLSRLVRYRFVCDAALEALSDRDCGFLAVASQAGIAAHSLPASTGQAFSDLLHARFAGRDDVVFLSFYTRLLKGDFVFSHRGRIFNCHPSLLPSFKGMHGFEDTLDSSATFMGSTLHAVDEGMDSGPIVLQAALPLDRSLPLATNRHRLFLSQVYSALQFIRWVRDGRLQIGADRRPQLTGARWKPAIFAPNLDHDFFDFIGDPDELA